MVADVATKRTGVRFTPKAICTRRSRSESLRGLRTHVAVRFIKHYPFQGTPETSAEWGYLPYAPACTRSMVALVKRRGGLARSSSRARLLLLAYFFSWAGRLWWGFAIVEAKRTLPSKPPRPGIEPVSLAVDKRVERVKKKRPHAF